MAARVLISRHLPRALHPQCASHHGIKALGAALESIRTISVSALRAQGQIFYTKKHEWVRMDQENVGTVGISNYAQEALGDVVYAQLPEPETEIVAGEECGALESVKAASEIFSPVSGTVVEKNDKVEAGPSLINTSPLEEGWLFKVKLGSKANAELEKLLNQEKYDQFLKSQEKNL